MRHTSFRRGFTLLEVMISSVIGVIVLGVGLVVGLQMQRRALFEEQTMTAQVTARAVKDMLATDLARAGAGMGNVPITFADGDSRFAIQAWSDLDLTAGLAPVFPPDPTFAPPPAPYEDFTSDVLQLYWGDTRSMVMMRGCGGGVGTTIREGASANFCTASVPPASLGPTGGQPSVPAIIVNPTGNVACHLEISNLITGAQPKINANPGSAFGNTAAGPCGDVGHNIWRAGGWLTMRTQSAAWRVNWANNIPRMEYLAPGGAAWVTVSEDVERMKIRHAVIDLSAPNAPYRWFPDVPAGRLRAIDQCTLATCTVDPDPAPAGAPDTDAELVSMLRQRVRELEVTLTIRTQRADRTEPLPPGPLELDEEGFPMDGFKRRTVTFRVAPRNFGAAGRQPALAGGP